MELSALSFEEDRIYLTRSRSAFRGLLASYVAIPATENRFEGPTSGKPQIARKNRECLKESSPAKAKDRPCPCVPVLVHLSNESPFKYLA
jgi:hypothetical protein